MFRIAVLFAYVAVCSAHAVLPLAHSAVAAPVVPALHGYGRHGLAGFGGHGLAGYGGSGLAGYGGSGLAGYGGLGLAGYGGHGLGGYGGLGHGGYGAHELTGYGFGNGGHGLLEHGLAKPIGHHILKRSPHYVAPVGHLGAVGHLGSIGHLGGLGNLGGHEALLAIGPVVAPVAVSHQSRLDVRHEPAVVAAPFLPVVAAPLAYGGLYGADHGAGHYSIGQYGLGHGHYGAGHLGHY